MVDVVNHGIELGRVGYAQSTGALRVVELSPLLSEIGASFAAMLAEQDQRISLDLSETPLWVKADERTLRQVVMNLIANSCKYDQRASAIRRRGSSDPDRGVARLEIVDGGPGIQASVLERLGAPFIVGGGPGPQPRSAVVSSGLGLRLVKDLIEALDGMLAFDVTPGEGTTVTIELPLGAGPRTHGRPQPG